MKPSPSIPQPVHIVYDDELSNAKRDSGAVCLTDVTPHDVAWLWPGRIPLGNVTLLVSDPGVGKSLVALDIAARVTTGRSWPDECSRHTPCAATEPLSGSNNHVRTQSNEVDQLLAGAADGTRSVPATRGPSSVLLINIEDHFHNTIRPRLDASGADCARIMAWTYVPGDVFVEAPHLFALTRDLDRLSNLVFAMQDCRLVILDPITAFLGDSSDQSSADVWKLLSALASLARKHNFAVLAVSHLRKKEGAAIHRALGSLAFVAAARAVWTVAKDCADANKRLLLPLKNNLASDTKGLAFTIETHEPTQAAVIRWLPETIEAHADAVLTSNRQPGRPDEERQFAIQWLRHELERGQSPVRKLRAAAEAHGITWGTLRRAFRELGAKAVFKSDDGRTRWDWRLPVLGAQNPGGEFCAPINILDESADHVSN